MANFFTGRPQPEVDTEGMESVFAINLDRVKTIIFVLAEGRCVKAELQLDKEMMILRNDAAQDLYDILRD